MPSQIAEGTPAFFGPVEAKLRRAERHARGVAESVSLWTAANDLRTRCELRAGRLGYRLVVEDFNEPPEFEYWGLAAGDCIHNLRSALDNLIFALARLTEDPPRSPRQLQFPLYADRVEFEQRGRQLLSQLPTDAALMVESLQPFQRDGSPANGTPETDPLLLLHWLSVADKHRVPSIVLMAPRELSFSFGAKFYSDDDAEANTPPDTTVWAGPLLPGVVLLEHRTTAPLESVQGEMRGEYVVAIEGPSEPLPVGALLRDLGAYVWTVVGLFRPFFE